MQKILLLFSISLIIGVTNVSSQNITQSFEGNNFKWFQSTSGLLFFDEENSNAGMEIPIGEGNHSIFASALWVGGMKDDTAVVSFAYYCQNEDYYNCIEKWGPLNLSNAQTTLQVAEAYNRFWFVHQNQIDLHLNYYNCVANPSCDTSIEYPIGYEIPEAFETWPAHGQEGYAEFLAPFVDFNSNGVYDPENGDHPAICGDFSTYQITNDVGTENTNDSGVPLGIEIHTRVYGYNAIDGALFNTLFVQNKIINRSENTYTDTYLSTFTDIDLGDPSDDFLGTDVSRSMFFGYNGDAYDESNQNGPGYGTDLPIIGVRYLGGPFKDEDGIDNEPISEDYTSYGNETTGWGDGITDNERLGLSSTLFIHTSLQETGQAFTPSGVHNIMKGIWKDGMPMTYGGDGYDSDSDVTTKYFFPGNSDPLFVGTNGEDPNYPYPGGWTEENGDFWPGDRRMLASSGSFTFASGDVQYLDYAFVFARMSHNPDLALRDILNQYADEIVGMECAMLPDIVTGIKEATPQLSIDVFPNPAMGELTIKSYTYNATFTLFDLEGRSVMQGKLSGQQTVLSVDNLNAGMYLLKVQSNEGVGVKKVVIK